MAKNSDTCAVKFCRHEGDIIFYGKKVCEDHWNMHASDESPFDLFDEFNIEKSTGELPKGVFEPIENR